MEDQRLLVQCCVDGPELRSLSKMLACCDALGKEVYLQATETGSCCGASTSRSRRSSSSTSSSTSSPTSCGTRTTRALGSPGSSKLFLKNVVSVFKNVAALEKAWRAARRCGGGESYLRIQQFCKNGTRKKFDLAFEEETPLQAVYQRDACAHRVTAEPVLLTNCLGHFPPGVSEVTLQLEPTQLVLKNEVDAAGATQDEGQRAEKVAVRTEMQVQAEDLQRYEVGAGSGGVTVSFSQREFKAVLSLLKELEMLVSIWIEAAARPIIFAAEQRDGAAPAPFAVDCVLATVVDAADDLLDDMDEPFGEAPPQPQSHGHPAAAEPSHQQQQSASSSSTSSRARLRRGRARRRATPAAATAAAATAAAAGTAARRSRRGTRRGCLGRSQSTAAVARRPTSSRRRRTTRHSSTTSSSRRRSSTATPTPAAARAA